MRTFVLFFLNMAIAVTLGVVMMNVIEPGAAMAPEARAQLLEEYGGAAAQHVAKRAEQPDVTPMAIVEMFMPRNLFGAFVGNDRNRLGDVLPLILFAILVGAAAVKLREDRREQLRSGLGLVTDLMTGIVHFALRLAPYAVPAMIYSVVVKIGWDIVIALGLFVAGCIFVMLLHLFGTMSLWLRLLARRNPLETFRLMRPVLVTAFSTSSSAATLPTALAVAREDLGVRAPVAGFVLPLGTTMNMSGTALFEGCVVLFVAQVFGIELGLAQQATLVLLAVLSAVAVSAIPGGALPLVAGLLAAFGIPPEGIGIILGVERLLDMTRTMVNVGSDVVTTIVVDRLTKLDGQLGADRGVLVTAAVARLESPRAPRRSLDCNCSICRRNGGLLGLLHRGLGALALPQARCRELRLGDRMLRYIAAGTAAARLHWRADSPDVREPRRS